MGTAKKLENYDNYWNEFGTIVFQLYYLQYYLERDQRITRWINMFLAVTSTVSIANWAIWGQMGYFWPAIIAGSQVLNVISVYLPFKTREKTLRALIPRANKIMLDCEDTFGDIINGELDDDTKIFDAMIKYKRAMSEISDGILECGLPENPILIDLAASKSLIYLNDYIKK